MSNFRERLARVRERMEKVAGKSGRSGSDVLLVAVTKRAAAPAILEAREAGLTVFAENRVQAAAEKIPALAGDPPCQWHMIGHLQSNKVNTALSLFDVIQSVDSVRLAEMIDAEAQSGEPGLKRVPVEILLEINISGEPKRFGFGPEEIYAALDGIAPLRRVRVTGLMGMAPHPAAPETKREAFKKLRNIFSVCKGLMKDKSEMRFLSMGMSDDFESAIEEGSNMIRIGRLLFA